MPRLIILRIAIIAWATIAISGCYKTAGEYAPVVEGWQQPTTTSGYYRVKRGDTLYSIAWAFGLDYRDLARVNHLSASYELTPGQRLVMQVGSAHATKTAKVTSRRSSVAVKTKPHRWLPFRWRWPVAGRIVKAYQGSRSVNQGVDIGGRLGEAVRVAAPGKVVYSGDGIRGYGNLIIVKHNANYLSAYAFNQKNLVRIDEWVKTNQVIARMGHNNANRVMLHFEIRRNGKPVNPLHYLPKR